MFMKLPAPPGLFYYYALISIYFFIFFMPSTMDWCMFNSIVFKMCFESASSFLNTLKSALSLSDALSRSVF